ncbi:hypothetical protein AOLI_G00313720 [Acnodon oligacanthus]
MCVEAMPTEEKRPRVDRPPCSRSKKRRLACVNLLKAAVRRYTALWEVKKRRSHRRWPRVGGGQPGLPSGAMAPRNTTQYLMELVYSDLSARGEFDFSAVNRAPGREEPFSPHSVYSSLYSEEETMDFQQRDFEDAVIAEQPNPETLCSYCVDVSLPTEREPRPGLVRPRGQQVNLSLPRVSTVSLPRPGLVRPRGQQVNLSLHGQSEGVVHGLLLAHQIPVFKSLLQVCCFPPLSGGFQLSVVRRRRQAERLRVIRQGVNSLFDAVVWLNVMALMRVC